MRDAGRALLGRSLLFHELQPLQVGQILFRAAGRAFHPNQFIDPGERGRYAEKLTVNPAIPDVDPLNARNSAMYLDAKKSTEREVVARNEILWSVGRIK